MGHQASAFQDPRKPVQQLIAVIDDEQDILDLYQMMLSPLGEVRTFSNPENFIKTMNSDSGFRPDVIITDYSMPNMTGVKMIQSIHDPDHPIATILLSGYLDKEKSISAVNSGVNKILEKPVVKKDLVHLTQQLLLEARNKKIQAEIADVMSKLKELFECFRLLCLNELDLKSMHEPLVSSGDTKPGPEAQLGSLEQDLDRLQERLQNLFRDQAELTQQLGQAQSRV
jgi:FixJ family two-component response regulator